MTSTYKIESDDDAWHLLDMWLNNERLPSVEFNNWPRLKIKVNGRQYQASMHSRQMDALVSFQMSMGRAYAAITHGSYDKRRLKQNEEDSLDFSTSVSKGSSILETDLTPLIDALSKVATVHPEATLIAGVLVSLALIARPMVLKHFEVKAKQLDKDEREKLVNLLEKITDDDREKASKFENALGQLSETHPSIVQIVPDLAQSYWRFASASTRADTLTVGDVELTKSNLIVLSERREARSIDKKQVEDVFTIAGIVKIGQSYRIQMKGPSYFVSVIYKEKSLVSKGISELMLAMAQSTPVKASIELKTIDGSQIIGRLLDFEVLPKPEMADEEI